MINRIYVLVNKVIETSKTRTIFFILLLISFLIRFPFFFRDYIDRDESTFILIGQSWVDGNLPYTELWDIKPPLVFLFFAAIIYSFGKSFLAIRFFGTLLVAITAFFTYKIGLKLTPKKISFWAAIGCIFLQSLFGSVQGVMSEHIVIAFFMSALYLIISSKGKIYTYFISGLLMGISVMVKLNVAYAILFCGIFIGYSYFKKRKIQNGMYTMLAYGVGIILIILLTALPYYLSDNFDLWWKSVFVAPLEYASARRYSILKLAPTFLLIALFFFVTLKKRYLDLKNIKIQLLIAVVFGVLLSFYKGGRINSHYLIQLYPVFVLLVVSTVAKIGFFKRFRYKSYLILVPFLLPIESYLEYYNIINHKIEKNSFFNGEGIEVPKYLLANNLETNSVFFTEYHIGYWTLGIEPPTKAATHPSNIFKDEMFFAYNNPRETGLDEIKFIMGVIRPKIVVVRKNRSIFDKDLVVENEYINSYLEQHYKVLATVEQADIYQRLEGL